MSAPSELRALLTAAVRESTGLDSAEPRDGQMKLSRDIDRVLQAGEGHVAGIAPTGSGKSLAALVPAARLALQGGRTLMSTESLGLQHQVTDKDFPAVRKVVAEQYGRELEIAVLKGWSNYVCASATVAQANAELERSGRPTVSVTGSSLAEQREALTTLSELVTDPLVKWALAPTTTTGDKSEYPGRLGDGEWEKVSTTPDSCLKTSCPLMDLCFPAAARRKAAAADIVVTNHHLLAVQAAKAVPVVIGSPSLGDFDAVVLDEAHTLPGIVRSAGALEVSERRMTSAVRTLVRVLPEQDREVADLAAAGRSIAEQLDQEVAAVAKIVGGDGAKLEEGFDPLPKTGPLIERWCADAARLIGAMTKVSSGTQQLEAMKASARIARIAQDVDELRQGGIGVARWVQMPSKRSFGAREANPAICLSPVDVSGALSSQVWSAPVPQGEEEGERRLPDGSVFEDEEPRPESKRRPLPVVAISATLPRSFTYDAGLPVKLSEYPSPFADAYENSLLYVPRMEVMGRKIPLRTYGRRKALDTREHPAWALAIMRDLIEANGGHAIVLSATSSAGREYATQLRLLARGRWRVYSQWDGMSKEATTNAWRSDATSVLVGTRSYMTGVDAPGRTCSLVIIDRVPRGAGNVVDDARVEVMVAQGKSEHRARDMVYAMDAAQLLEQAAGRLIRSTSDSGMVAILDPRLLKSQDIAYAPTTRKIYMDALRYFPNKTADLSVARDFLLAQGETPGQVAKVAA